MTPTAESITWKAVTILVAIASIYVPAHNAYLFFAKGLISEKHVEVIR